MVDRARGRLPNPLVSPLSSASKLPPTAAAARLEMMTELAQKALELMPPGQTSLIQSNFKSSCFPRYALILSFNEADTIFSPI